MNTIQRFSLFCLLFLTSLLKAQSDLNIHPDLIKFLDPQLAPFYHGVASGDPTESAVILWTKLTLSKKITDAVVEFEVATDSIFQHQVKSGIAHTDGSDDFTIKIDIDGLTPGTNYYYRFLYNNQSSIIGKTQTLPSNPDRFYIAFASCSNYEWGYFNNYKFIANNPTINLVVHLGDYIYEYAPNGYGDTTIGRVHVPAKEITTLEDYRTRYSQYRLDKDLMKLHQLKSTITTWDDHEIANNGCDDGAQNHQPNEGDWKTRKAYGKQCYYEWMPVRDNSYHELYRSFKIGNLLELIILDTRITGRSKQVDNESDPHYMDTSRTILGKTQYDWFLNRLRDQSTTWKIVGNQVPFGILYQPDFNGGAGRYMDGWDGYPVERNRLVNTIHQEKLRNIVWVTGDYHVSFALENDLKGTATTKDNASVEFVVTSITSSNDDEFMPRDSAIAGQQDYLQFNPHMKYVNNVDNGFVVVTIDKNQVYSSFFYAPTVREPADFCILGQIFKVKKNKPILIDISKKLRY